MKVSVIGAGVMGPGIAQVFLMAGHEVALNDLSEACLVTAKAQIAGSLAKMHDMAIVPEDAAFYLARLTLTQNLQEAVQGAKLVVEAIPEQVALKKTLYAQLDLFCDADAMITSNTSSLPLPEMFPDFRTGHFCVTHFFNPPPIIPLVEVVKNDAADQASIDWLKKVLQDCGKTVIVINKFVKGFLINRLQAAMSREALYLFEQGVVSAEELDDAAMAGIGFKTAWQGFFDTMDFVGLDTVLFANDLMFPELSNAPTTPQLIRDKVEAGKLGTKTEEGFYDYHGGRLAQVNDRRQEVLLEQLKLWNKYRPCQR